MNLVAISIAGDDKNYIAKKRKMTVRKGGREGGLQKCEKSKMPVTLNYHIVIR